MRYVFAAVLLAAAVLAGLAGCTSPVVQQALMTSEDPVPRLLPDEQLFVSFDGAELGLDSWMPEAGEPDLVVIGVHGLNTWAGAFQFAGPWWAERGAATYAYDQRGFGRSPGRGYWTDEEVMREDLRTLASLVRERHPGARIGLVGISMGGALAASAFASERPPDADMLILSGPGFRGWGALPLLYRTSLWLSVNLRPGWIVRPPSRFVRIEPTSDPEFAATLWNDPLLLRENRVDQLHGAIRLMETAHQRIGDLPADLPVLVTYGANDIVVPEDAFRRTAQLLPAHVRTAFYEKGWHMLFWDVQRETVWADYLAFLRDPDAPLPSGAPPYSHAAHGD